MFSLQKIVDFILSYWKWDLDVESIGNVPQHFGESVHGLSGQFVQPSCKKLQICTTCK